MGRWARRREAKIAAAKAEQEAFAIESHARSDEIARRLGIPEGLVGEWTDLFLHTEPNWGGPLGAVIVEHALNARDVLMHAHVARSI